MDGHGHGMLQLFVRLIDGKTAILQFSGGSVYASEIKEKIYEITRIPTSYQRLVSGGHQLADDSLVSVRDSTINLLLRLLGGKGGFGSLLRGAATKAGQKKTRNFDACRDMSGRRLRHVNAEKRLEEWRTGEEERKLERLAEDFLKKQMKKNGGSKASAERAAEKYVEGYRKQSAKCVGAVEEAVKEACSMVLKRKGRADGDPSDAKKLKIWMGKRKLVDSDGDDSTDDDEDESGSKTSVITSSADTGDEKPEPEGSSDSVADGALQRGAVGGPPAESGSEGEKLAERKASPSSDEDCSNDAKAYFLGQEKAEEVRSENDARVQLDDYSSAADLMVLGLERLKKELSARGLKCGGTLEERAARLFLLKTTPFDELPKKLLAKK